MTAKAAFADRLVLENKRTSLRGVTLETGVVLTKQSKTAALDGLRKIGPAAFDRASLMRVVTIGATHFAFQHRMMVR